jgi:hypothetical protein
MMPSQSPSQSPSTKPSQAPSKQAPSKKASSQDAFQVTIHDVIAGALEPSMMPSQSPSKNPSVHDAIAVSPPRFLRRFCPKCQRVSRYVRISLAIVDRFFKERGTFLLFGLFHSSPFFLALTSIFTSMYFFHSCYDINYT